MQHIKANGFPDRSFVGREGKNLQMSFVRDLPSGDELTVIVLTVDVSGHAIGPGTGHRVAKHTTGLSRREAHQLLSGLDAFMLHWHSAGRPAVPAPLVLSDAGQEWLRVEIAKPEPDEQRLLKVTMRTEAVPEFGPPLEVMKLRYVEASRWCAELGAGLDRDAMTHRGYNPIRLAA